MMVCHECIPPASKNKYLDVKYLGIKCLDVKAISMTREHVSTARGEGVRERCGG